MITLKILKSSDLRTKNALNRLVIGREYSEDVFRYLAEQPKYEYLGFNSSNLTKQKLKKLKGSFTGRVEVQALWFTKEETLEAEGYHDIAEFLSNAKSKSLCFEYCNLTDRKIDLFSQGAAEQRVKLDFLGIEGELNIKLEAYHTLGIAVVNSSTSRFVIADCNLTGRKVDFFNQALESRKYKLAELYVQDKTLEFKEYYNVAELASTTKIESLRFVDSDLNFDKLDYFSRGASENKLQLHTFAIMEEKSMEPEVFFKFAHVASVTNSEDLDISNCNLTNEKLDSFSQGALEYELKINTLYLEDKAMNPGTFFKFAQVASITEAKIVQFANSNLTSEKLNAFSQGATDFGLKIDELTLSDKTMKGEAFRKFTEVASITNAGQVLFINCSLTSEKLKVFRQGAADRGLKINTLYLADKIMEPKAFHEFAQVASTVEAGIVQFAVCNLTCEKLNEFAQGATDFALKIDDLIVSDKTMQCEAFHEFAEVASITKSGEVCFINCSLTSEKLKVFRQGAANCGLKINFLYLADKIMGPKAFHEFAQVASTVAAGKVQFCVCNLTSEKLNAFAQGATDFGLKFDTLTLSDKTMKGEAFRKFTEVASITNAREVSFINCSLTSEKLKVFRQGAADRGLKINTLYIADKIMEPKAFHEFAQVASTVEAGIVQFVGCDLTCEKLNEFAQGATDFSLQIEKLTLYDKTMKGEAFREFTEVASITNAGQVSFINCSLTSEKLKVFRQGAADRGLKINTLYLADKIMEPKAFHEFAQVASTVEAGKVQFAVCNLTCEKLNEFAQGATDFALKFDTLTLSDKTMEDEALCKFTEVASITNAKQVSFINCSLTSEKLKVFRQGSADRGLKINTLYLADKIMEPKAFHEFAQVASTVEAGEVQFGVCDLTCEKLNEFAQGATDVSSKINTLYLADKIMEPKAFHEFAQVASTVEAGIVQFGVCDLTCEKLNEFAQGATDFSLQIDDLIVSDETMKCEAFNEFAEVASITKAGEVSFLQCGLTSEKLKVFRQRAADRGLKINTLYLADKIMEPKAFHEFAQVASTVEAGKVQFGVCDLTCEKLNEFAQGATDFALKIDDLIVSDKTMECEAFHEFAEVASITKSGEVSFINCSLTSEKLKVLRQGAANCGLKTNNLYLADEIMDPMAFHEFAQVASSVEAGKVQFGVCNLTSEKLNSFAHGATDNSLKFDRLTLSDKTMKGDAFRKFTEVASITNAVQVSFINCSLTSEKLKVFRQGAADRGLKINTLDLADKIMEPKAFHEFAQVASTVEAGKVQFNDCNLTCEKLNEFAQGATDFSLKIRRLILKEEPKPSQNTAQNLFQMFSNVEGRLFRDGWEIDESNNELIIRYKDCCQSATVRPSRIQRIKKSITDIFRRRNRE
ncbi:uncharacterized protein LOC120336047 [Styela clava]